MRACNKVKHVRNQIAFDCTIRDDEEGSQLEVNLFTVFAPLSRGCIAT